MRSVARAAMIGVNLETGDVAGVDLWNNHADDDHGSSFSEDPATSAHTFARALRDDWPGYTMTVIANKEAREIRAKTLTDELFGAD